MAWASGPGSWISAAIQGSRRNARDLVAGLAAAVATPGATGRHPFTDTAKTGQLLRDGICGNVTGASRGTRV